MLTNIMLPILVLVLLILVISLYVQIVKKTKHLAHLAEEITRIRREEEVNEKMKKSRDDFIAMLVHELRSPLSVIKGASDLVLKEAEKLSPDQIKNLLAQIRTSSEGLLAIVNDMLDVSKMEAGKFDVDKEFSDITKLIDYESSYYTSLAAVKGIEIGCDFEENIPMFNFDPNRIKQVMNNLLSNAIKYTENNGKVNIIVKKKEDHIEVCVEDNGVGVKSEDRGLLFQKYMRTKNSKVSPDQTTGLGLVIAKGIVDAHGGNIWYESNEPKGSKFIFSLPFR